MGSRTPSAWQRPMRDVIKRHSMWYLLQGALMVFTGLVALLFPVFSSVAVVLVLGWLLIFSGIFQAISLIGATNVPHFWLQLISVRFGSKARVQCPSEPSLECARKRNPAAIVARCVESGSRDDVR